MRKLLGIVVAALILLSSFVSSVAPVAAEGASHLADSSCGGGAEPWPNQTRLKFRVTDHGDGSYTAAADFRLTQAEIDALACVAPNVEVDFRLSGFNIPEGWSDYTFGSRDWPDKLYDVAITRDGAFMRSTGAEVSDLVPRQNYHLEVTFWNVEPLEGRAHELSLEWVPGEWLLEDCGQNLVYFGEDVCRTRFENEGAVLGVYTFDN